jgi:hypothetical protein
VRFSCGAGTFAGLGERAGSDAVDAPSLGATGPAATALIASASEVAFNPAVSSLPAIRVELVFDEADGAPFPA